MAPPDRSARRDADHVPVLKFFNPRGRGTWLVSELDSNVDTLFGLCEVDYPELGYARLSGIAAARLPFGLRIERDLHFTAEHSLSVYARAARAAARTLGEPAGGDRAMNRAEPRPAISEPGRQGPCPASSRRPSTN